MVMNILLIVCMVIKVGICSGLCLDVLNLVFVGFFGDGFF